MPNDEFYAMEDGYILYPEISKEKSRILQSKYRNVLAIVLIVIGVSILWNNMYDILNWIVPSIIGQIMYQFGYYFPQFIVGAAIIALGVYLIRGKKQDLDQLEKSKMLEDRGGNALWHIV